VPEYRWWERWLVRAQLDILPIAALSLSATFFEEVFYRGYAITRLHLLIGSASG